MPRLSFLALLPLAHGAELIDGFTFVGCYKDDADRDLSVYIGTEYDHVECDSACKGYAYFALQYGDECFCGDSYGTPEDLYPRLPDGDCQRTGYCATCGGGWANAVFIVAPPPPST